MVRVCGRLPEAQEAAFTIAMRILKATITPATIPIITAVLGADELGKSSRMVKGAIAADRSRCSQPFDPKY